MSNKFIHLNYPYSPSTTQCSVSVPHISSFVAYNSGSRIFFTTGGFATVSQTPAQVQNLLDQAREDAGYASGLVSFTDLSGNKHQVQVDDILALTAEEPDHVYQIALLGGTFRMRETPSAIFSQMKQNA